MVNSLLSLLVLSRTLCSVGGAVYVHLEDNWNVVHEVDVGEQIQLTCESSSRDIDFYLTGISGKIKNSSEHFFPGSNLIITELSEHYDNYGQRLFHKSLRLTMTAEINNTAVQCGAKEYDTASMRLIWVYSLAVLLRTSAPPYVDIKLIDRGEREADGKVRIECNSSSEHIIFCVVGTPCDSEYSHGLPNGSNPSLSDTLDYYSNESGRTLYTRTLELSVVDLDNIALQCKAGKGVQAFTRTVLFFLTGSLVEKDEGLPTPKGLTSPPSSSETLNLTKYPGSSGLSPRVKWGLMPTLLLTVILTVIYRL